MNDLQIQNIQTPQQADVCKHRLTLQAQVLIETHPETNLTKRTQIKSNENIQLALIMSSNYQMFFLVTGFLMFVWFIWSQPTQVRPVKTIGYADLEEENKKLQFEIMMMKLEKE